MEYIIFDLEFNQGFDRKLNKTVSNEKCPFEIIQIGAIKLDSDFNIVDTFNSYIKPTIYKEMHPFISRMTNIKNSDFINSPTFPEVYNNFIEFISSHDPILCVWGIGDLKELYKNINYHKLTSSILPKSYINIQQHASKYFNNPAGKSVGLQNAISMLELDEKMSYHNALNDAYYTAKVFIKIYNPSIVPDIYIYTNIKSASMKYSNKKKVDYDKLFDEFKKILDRDLTKDEKKIINLAYNMGKTNQFAFDSSKPKKNH